MDLLTSFFGRSGFLPHGYCFTWSPGLLWTMVSADALIALAYFSMPVALVYFARKRADSSMNWLLWCFSAFIFSCGVTHVMDIWTIWRPDYGLQALTKAVTAGVSAFAVGADDEQRALGGAQVVGLQLRQAAQPRRHTGGVQRLCCLPGDLLGRAGLAGVHDQHRPRTVGGRRQGGGGALGVEQSLPMQPPGAGAQSEVGQRNAAGREEAHGVVREAHRQGSNAEWQAARPRFMPAGPRRRPSGEPRDRRHCDE